MADVINVITIIFVLICWIIFIHKIVINKNAKIKTVKAKVVDSLFIITQIFYICSSSKLYVYFDGEVPIIFLNSDEKCL